MNIRLYIYIFTILPFLFINPFTERLKEHSGTTIVYAKKKPSSLRRVWETDTLLRTPESVLHEPTENVLLVSNINGNGAVKDGNGFISKLTLEGQITSLEWATGLNAPKGMGISGNKLFVA